jgi:ADP-sugar diphosphatase
VSSYERLPTILNTNKAQKNWIHTLTTNLSLQYTDPHHSFHSTPYVLRSITVQSLDRFGPHSTSRIGFIKLQTLISNDLSENLPGAVFLRGASVAMLVILQPDDVPQGSEEEKHVLLTLQPRVAVGSLGFCELPAGMVDDGTFKGAAAKEIEEELGLRIEEDDLVNLNELALEDEGEGEREGLSKAMYPSAGACDECISIFMHEKRVPRDQLKEWTGKLTGLREEGEKVRVSH